MLAGEQVRVLLAMALCGAALGAAYDGLALIRWGLHIGRMGTGVLDVCFGALCAAGMTVTALAMQVNPFRWYEFAGVAGGVALYAASIGTLARAIGGHVSKKEKKEENGKNGRKKIGKNPK